MTQRVQKLQIFFGRNYAPCESVVRRLMKKFETIGLVLTVKSPGQKCSCLSEEQLVFVQNCHCESRKVDSPTFVSVGYANHFIASNFASHNLHFRKLS